ncbi:MAG: winged helix-turn-helix domain-containing protein [Planctomycetota bacterium]|jgi:DNA-binding MarR family transcriptional regulator
MAGSKTNEKEIQISAALKLNPMIHERARLAILTALGAHGRLTFNELKSTTGTTDGNLSTHSNKLEEAGYVNVDKGVLGRRKRTTYEITPKGKKELLDYLDELEELMGNVRK